MSAQTLSIIGLVLIVLIATWRSVNMGAIAFLGALIFGTLVFKVSEDDLFAGFPGDLFAVLVGITFLFAIAKSNGTVDWLINAAVRGVQGRIALIPWVMFLVTAVFTSVGAVVPGAVAIMAPIGMTFAARHRINPMLMGLLIINGGSAGGFSPIGVFGILTNDVVAENDLPTNPVLLWVCSFAFNALLSVVVFIMFGGRELLNRQVTEPDPDPDSGTAGTGGATKTNTATEVTTLNAQRIVTLVGVLTLVVGMLAFDIDTGYGGLLALGIAAVICVLFPRETKASVSDIAWPTVLLICGVVTYVNLLDRMGTIDMVGSGIADIGAALLAAFVICFIGAAVSAFASTTGILRTLVPIAVPFLLTGQVGTVGLVIALAISSSVVDSSPFSTSGALTVASTPEEHRDRVFRGLMIWGMSMIVVAPVLAWLIFVVPGWL